MSLITLTNTLSISTECLWNARNQYMGVFCAQSNKNVYVNMGPWTLRFWVMAHFKSEASNGVYEYLCGHLKSIVYSRQLMM
jgi:hypothetical protein